MYDVYTNVHGNEVVGKRDFMVAVNMDIHRYIHVWISDIRHAVDASTDV